MKDNFSKQSTAYAQFRPGYPAALYDYLYEHCRSFEVAWDCATGNGQIAVALAEKFARVEATDISENQIRNAMPRPGVHYALGSAETSGFPAHTFDLVTVGQAAHWFDFKRFYPEMQRVLKPGGLLALIGYNMLRVDAEVDAFIDYFYHKTLQNCWDAERGLVEKAYKTIPFPLREIPFPEMHTEYRWTVDQLWGYLGTWSAVQHFIRQNGHSPLDEAMAQKLAEIWPAGLEKIVRFPVFGRIGSY